MWQVLFSIFNIGNCWFNISSIGEICSQLEVAEYANFCVNKYSKEQ